MDGRPPPDPARKRERAKCAPRACKGGPKTMPSLRFDLASAWWPRALSRGLPEMRNTGLLPAPSEWARPPIQREALAQPGVSASRLFQPNDQERSWLGPAPMAESVEREKGCIYGGRGTHTHTVEDVALPTPSSGSALCSAGSGGGAPVAPMAGADAPGAGMNRGSGAKGDVGGPSAATDIGGALAVAPSPQGAAFGAAPASAADASGAAPARAAAAAKSGCNCGGAAGILARRHPRARARSTDRHGRLPAAGSPGVRYPQLP